MPLYTADRMRTEEATESIAEQLGRFVHGLRFEQLSSDAVAATQDAILDLLGCILVGSRQPWTQPVLALTEDHQGGVEATVVGSGVRAAALDAAYVNAVAATACELDDFLERGHPGSVSVPAGLAIAERDRRSGKDLLLAVAVGYEVLGRVGRAVARPVCARGLSAVGVVGPLGAAAVSGKLLGLDARKLTQALAIASTHAGGTLAYDHGGGTAKALLAATATRSGMVSAYLAREGLTGPRRSLEGRRGLLRLFAAAETAPENGRDAILGDPMCQRGFRVEQRSVKVAPIVLSSTTAVQALRRLMREHGVVASRVSSIDVWLRPFAAQHAGHVGMPHDVVSAQFSLPFCLALQAVTGRLELADLADPERWSDPELRDLAARVTLHPRPLPPGEPASSVRMEITLRDGPCLETIERERIGSPKRPLSRTELHQRFRTMAAAAQPPERVEAILELVQRLPELDDAGELGRALAACPSTKR